MIAAIDTSEHGQWQMGVANLIAAVTQEMIRQVEKWGIQKHPVLHYRAPLFVWSELAAGAKNDNDMRAIDGEIDWYGILEEEFYEALETADAGETVTEFVQTAAVALAAAYSVMTYGREGGS